LDRADIGGKYLNERRGRLIIGSGMPLMEGNTRVEEA
jgi:hypothetical protein